MQVSPKPESEWDETTRALYDLYNGPSGVPGTIEPGTEGSTVQISGAVSGTPNSDWDSADTSGYGIEFDVGSFVQDNDTDILYRCVDNTPGAAVWYKVVQERV